MYYYVGLLALARLLIYHSILWVRSVLICNNTTAKKKKDSMRRASLLVLVNNVLVVLRHDLNTLADV